MAEFSGKILRCVLTGGPCGGKSSCISHLRSLSLPKDESSGDSATSIPVTVVTVPEISTILLSNGAFYPGLSNYSDLLKYETMLLALQLQLEDSFQVVAELHASRGRNVLILYDRAALDVKAYVSEDVWVAMLEAQKVTEKQLIERYDMVVHLNTAADGAEEFYGNATNSSRSESAAEARELDSRTYNCWTEHPCLRRIINRPVKSAFSVKMAEVVDTVKEKMESI